MQILFPQTHCPVCGKPIGEKLICDDCLDKLFNAKRCPRCGCFLHNTSLYCETCATMKNIYFDKAVCAFPYEGVFRKNILQLKFKGKTYYKRPFAEIILELLPYAYADIKFDLIVPVPVPPQRLRQRGYNQVALYAKPVAEFLGIPFCPEALFTLKENPSLVGQKRKERMKTVKNTFAADTDIVKDKTVLLFDDVFTTGATANACAKALKKAGAKAVYVITLAGHYSLN